MKILFGIIKYVFLSLVASTIVGSVIGGAFLFYFSRGLPNIITTEDYRPRTVTRVLGKGDIVVGEFFEERRYVVPYEQIPEIVTRAFVAAEDDRFFDHHGIDLQGILRAAFANFRAGRVVQGGSTITQQVAKSLLLTPEKSFVRKIKEVILANRMEKNLNKKQILYLYLNQIYLGQGAYGVQAAARAYFDKDVKDLTLAEAAILAGLPQAPSAYSPSSNPKKAKERQMYVLRRMVEDGAIKEEQIQPALHEPLRIFNIRDFNEKTAPYYVENIRKHLLQKYGKEGVYEKGLLVRTPIEPRLSIHAMRVVQEGLRNVDKRQGYRGPIKKSKGLKELAAHTAEVAEFNVSRKYPFKQLLGDGTFSTDPKSRIEPGLDPSDLFEEGELYQGVVMKTDDAKKEMLVDLGIAFGSITLDRMKWARRVTEPSPTALEPLQRPSQGQFVKGDVIWVKVAEKKTDGRNINLALEQIPLLQGALVSMDVNTGEVLAMVGGYDFKDSEFNRVVQAERQAGSAYKPIIYSAAIDKGYTPATIIQDSPLVFQATETEKWKPENFEEKFYGDTLFRSALIHSRNIPTIKIVQDIQVSYLMEYSKRLGITGNLNPDLSISLGSNTTSPMEMGMLYSVFARGGRRVKPIFIYKVTDRDGTVLEETLPTPSQPPVAETLASPAKPVLVAGQLQADINAGKSDPNLGVWTADPNDPDRVLDSRTAYVMTHLMNEVTTTGTGHGAKDLGRSAAGKTGTTNDCQDAWFVGFIPQMVTSVWVGFDALKTIGAKATGATVSLPIWLEYMKEAVKSYPVENFAVPKGVTFSYIDSRNGKPSSPSRPYAIREAFVEGTEPTNTRTSASSDGENSQSPSPGMSPAEEGGPDVNEQDFFKQDMQ